MAVKSAEFPSHLLAVNLTLGSEVTRLINIYAPNNATFFSKLPQLFTNHTVLGDFNSVISMADRNSHALDATSGQLQSLLKCFDFVEPKGSHLYSFSYQHPSLSNRKSHLDRIY